LQRAVRAHLDTPVPGLRGQPVDKHELRLVLAEFDGADRGDLEGLAAARAHRDGPALADPAVEEAVRRSQAARRPVLQPGTDERLDTPRDRRRRSQIVPDRRVDGGRAVNRHAQALRELTEVPVGLGVTDVEACRIGH
jgi:hypothetical protein